MPFGSFVAACYLALFAVWYVVTSGAVERGAAAGVAVATILLVAGLLRRAVWGRWVGSAAALVFGGLALRRLLLGDEKLVTIVALLAAPLVTLLLALPLTGAVRGDDARPPAASWPAWLAALALAVALVAGWQPAATSPAAAGASAGRGALPASARATPIAWHDLRSGLALARDSGKPLLVTVETSWCPYCKKMHTQTWAAPRVARRLDAVVAVRVDAEDGEDGSALAARYGVRGFPTQLLLDEDGALFARADGFQGPSQFLSWFDGALSGPAIGER